MNRPTSPRDAALIKGYAAAPNIAAHIERELSRWKSPAFGTEQIATLAMVYLAGDNGAPDAALELAHQAILDQADTGATTGAAKESNPIWAIRALFGEINDGRISHPRLRNYALRLAMSMAARLNSREEGEPPISAQRATERTTPTRP